MAQDDIDSALQAVHKAAEGDTTPLDGRELQRVHDMFREAHGLPHNTEAGRAAQDSVHTKLWEGLAMYAAMRVANNLAHEVQQPPTPQVSAVTLGAPTKCNFCGRTHSPTDDHGHLTPEAIAHELTMRHNTVVENPHAPGGWTYLDADAIERAGEQAMAERDNGQPYNEHAVAVAEAVAAIKLELRSPPAQPLPALDSDSRGIGGR